MADKPLWTFLSNHAHVIVCLSKNPDARLRDIAAEVGITERTAVAIVTDLEEAGIVTISKVGRRNSYAINKKAKLRHPLESHKTVGDLIKATS
jgi:DNA-binding MarR family transcriptional regulator